MHAGTSKNVPKRQNNSCLSALLKLRILRTRTANKKNQESLKSVTIFNHFLYRKSILTLRRWCQISGRRYKAGKNSRHWLPSLETCFFIVRVINVWTWRKLRSGLSDEAIERRRSTVKPSDQTVTAQSLSVSMNGRVASRRVSRNRNRNCKSAQRRC